MRKYIIGIVALTFLAGPALAGWEEGVAAFTKRDFQAAVNEFKQVVDQSPEAHQGYYMLGLSYEQLGNNQEALNHLRKAYDLNPNELGTKLALGRAYTNLRRFGDAAKLLSTVDPSPLPSQQKAAFYQMRAQARQQTSDQGGAYQDLQQLARLRPDDAQIQSSYGRSALAMGEIDTAVNTLAKAAQLAPGNLDIKKAYCKAVIRQARVSNDKAAKKRSYLKAANAAAEITAKEPSYDNYMHQIAAELGAGLYKEAAETGKKALGKKDSDWLAHFYTGQALSSVKQYEEAEPYLAKALSLASGPDNVRRIQRQRGFTFEKQKKWEESIAAYQAVGDSASAARVQKNWDTSLENKRIEQENELIEQMRKEAEELEKQLQELEEGEEGGGGRL